jgi:hypothetical protein
MCQVTKKAINTSINEATAFNNQGLLMHAKQRCTDDTTCFHCIAYGNCLDDDEIEKSILVALAKEFPEAA